MENLLLQRLRDVHSKTQLHVDRGWSVSIHHELVAVLSDDIVRELQNSEGRHSIFRTAQFACGWGLPLEIWMV